MVMSKRKLTSQPSGRYAKRFKGAAYRRGTAVNFVPRSLTARAPRRVELKRVDYFVNSVFNPMAAASIELLNGIAVGDDMYNREGRQVQYKGLELDLTLMEPSRCATNSFAQDICRLLVVYDSAPNGGSLPVAADFLRDITQAGSAYTINAAHQNVNNLHRFRILHDQTIHTPAWNIGNTIFTFSQNLKIKKKITVGKNMSFTGTGGTISSISNGAIYLMCGSASSTGPDWWTIEGTVRSYFTDV